MPDEINLGTIGSDDFGDRHSNEIRTSYSDLSAILTPGLTNEDLLSRILATPEDKLIPWEECQLPSMGIYYGWPDGTIKVRAMTQSVEKILATQRLAQSGQSIDHIFRECCLFPDGFDSADLLVGDRAFLLYYIRGITHGNIYEFVMTCPNNACGSVSTHKYDLNELASTIKWANRSLGMEPFRVVLPYMSKVVGRDITVGLRFMRGHDSNDIVANRKLRKRMFAQSGVRSKRTQDNRTNNQEIDQTITENLSRMIVNVLDVNDKYQIRSFIDKMHSQDTAHIRDWLRENTPSLDTTVSVVCPDCQGEYTMELPITENFFRPSKA